MSITLSLMMIGKIIFAIFGEGFLALMCLWPINDKPTSKTQFVVFAVISLVFLGWLFNWYHINFTVN